MKIQATFRRMLQMKPAAWTCLIWSLRMSCVFLFGSLVLLLAKENAQAGYELYIKAGILQEWSQLSLLAGALIPVCLEEL